MALQAPDMGMEMGIFQAPSMICLGGYETFKIGNFGVRPTQKVS